jgi:hypothetical protein
MVIRRSQIVLDVWLKKFKQLNEWQKQALDLRTSRERYIKRDVKRNEERRGHDLD